MAGADHRFEERVVEGQSPEKLLLEHRARYTFAVPLIRGRRVLDVACGSGYGSRMLLEGGAREVVGLDCDAEAIALARRRYQAPNLTYLQADACNPPSLQPFDVIVSFETIEHLADPERFLEVCCHLLVPGGMLIVSTPYRHRMRADGRPANPYHVREWRTDEFADLLRPRFSAVAMFGQALKIRSRRLPRWPAKILARLQGCRPGDVEAFYALPGPRFLGLWNAFPAYLIAVCRGPNLFPKPVGKSAAA